MCIRREAKLTNVLLFGRQGRQESCIVYILSHTRPFGMSLIIFVRVLFGNLLQKFHLQLKCIISSKHVTDPCDFSLHWHLNIWKYCKTILSILCIFQATVIEILWQKITEQQADYSSTKKNKKLFQNLTTYITRTLHSYINQVIHVSIFIFVFLLDY